MPRVSFPLETIDLETKGKDGVHKNRWLTRRLSLRTTIEKQQEFGLQIMCKVSKRKSGVAVEQLTKNREFYPFVIKLSRVRNDCLIRGKCFSEEFSEAPWVIYFHTYILVRLISHSKSESHPMSYTVRSERLNLAENGFYKLNIQVIFRKNYPRNKYFNKIYKILGNPIT